MTSFATTHPCRSVAFALLALACASAQATPATQRPLADAEATVPLDVAALSAQPREAIVAVAHGKTLRCEGMPLVDVLRNAQAMPDQPLRGAQLARYVLVTARDGYRAVYSLAELDPTLGKHLVFLVDRCDGKPLDAEDGPLRLIAPDEARPARWVRQVESITVVTAP